MLRVGLISDTHGLLRPEATNFLRGSDHIIHAGDIGRPEILDELARLAPLSVVRGNNDNGRWADAIAETLVVELGDLKIFALHDLAQLKPLGIDPAAAGYHVVVAGHSHQPAAVERDGVLYVNPGSAGPRRFKLPIAVGELLIDGASVQARLHELPVA
jgi:uncharacterized protein